MSAPGVYGAGWLPLDVALTLGCALACVLQLAVLRSPLISEMTLIEAMRRVRVVGWGLLAIRFGVLMRTDGDLPISIYALLPLLLLAWADVISALARLLPHGPPMQEGDTR